MSSTQVALEWEKESDETAIWSEVGESTADVAHDIVVAKESDGYRDLRIEIDRSKCLLNLKDDWDGEGSSGYSKETFDRAIAFLTSHIEWISEFHGICPPIPKIGPGPDGSIDLHWKQPSWELLVNIPADANQIAVFYGDNYGAQKIRGSIDTNKLNLGIASWLMNSTS